MPLAEAVTIEVGASIAKSILKLWTKDATLADDISSSLVDLFKAKTSDVLAQRRGQRQFDTIGEKVGESLLPLFEIEGANLDEGSRTAVAYAVAEAFNTSRISSELLAERNLQPTALAQHVLATRPEATKLFSATEEAFYKRIVQEACGYIVDIASQLPSFTERTFAEVLKREDQILARTDQVLRELKQLRAQLDPTVESERFEIDYRQAVSRNLDILQLIGADVSSANRRHRLSVAYITLSVEQVLLAKDDNGHKPLSPIDIDINDEEEEYLNEPFRDIISVNTALVRSQRLLIRGLAGSGKTTLLQWIAVRAATKSFEEELARWNDRLPFYIRLRQCVQAGLPRPEAFPGFVAPMIADTMPKGWVHNMLKSGRALVLVDGVDEIPALQREDVHNWLRDLVETYPRVQFVITSRPHAIEEGWMNHEDFSDAELQPMELHDTYSFIDHWHDAVREELLIEEEKAELNPLADHLKEHVRRTRSIRNLATSPLLCAMLCALNHDRRRQLPVNRVELYKACCSLLLERRDKESRIDLSDYISLNYGQKTRLLEELAYWMIKENLSEATVSSVDASFSSKLADMPNIAQEITGSQVRRFFVERAGIIREPIAGQIDFTHRTFEEFFAAQASLDAHDIDLLVANAHNDQWHEVIILAAGLASKVMCEQLIGGLVKRGDEQKELRYKLHLLAVSCLETSIELGSEVRAEVEKRLSKLVPPKNMTEAKALAVARDLAVKYLGKKEKMPATIAAACVRALALIGTEGALDMLEGYANETRVIVLTELLKAQDFFDRETYAKRIFAQLYKFTKYTNSNLSSLDGFQYLTSLTRLDLSGCVHINDVSVLAGLTNLTRLDLSGCGEQINDVSVLAGLTNLTRLYLRGFNQIGDMNALVKLKSLMRLDLRGCKQLSDVSALANLTKLTSLDLSYCEQLSDVSALVGLMNLTSLDLSYCKQLSDVRALANLTNLTSLDLDGCKQLSDVSALAGLTKLTSLDLSYCEQLSDVSALAGLTSLTRLDLRGCKQLSDVSALANLTKLTSLTLSGCEQLSSISPLAGLTKLTSLTLSGYEQLSDVSALANLTKLTSLTLLDCEQLSDVSALANLTKLTSLTLSGCEQLSSISPLAGLTKLTSLTLSDCEQLSDVSALANLTKLTSLTLSGCGQLRDVHALAGLMNLKHLHLYKCEYLSDTGYLINLTELTVYR